MKQCSQCGEEKPESEFGPNPKSKDKLDYRCRACGRVRRRRQIEKVGDKWQKSDAYKEHPTGRKQCGRCNQWKFIQEFSRDRSSTDGLQRTCRKCQVEQWQLSAYGCVVPEDGRCAICGRANSPVAKLGIDHCHKTRKVRGILCQPCNAGLGLFKDDASRLRKAAQYVEQSPLGRL
jgi:hypothetical protein